MQHVAQGREAFSLSIWCNHSNKNDLVRAIKGTKPALLIRKLSFKKKSVVLRLRPISNITYAEFHKVCEQYPILSQLENEYTRKNWKFIPKRNGKRLSAVKKFYNSFCVK